MVSVGWLVAVGVLALLGMYLRGLVGRLDRLHLRVEAAQEALDVQLLRRASLVRELAESGWLDPASAYLLVDAASQADRAADVDREGAESALTSRIRTVLEQPGVIEEIARSSDGAALLQDLAAACDRVVLARRFTNEAVRSTTEVRRRVVVRLLRLAGHAQMPRSFEMDDAPSEQLAQFADARP
jgi:hypothetical protein